MKLLLVLMLLIPAFGQEQQQAAAPAQAQAQATAPAKAEEKPAASPAPAGEQWVNGSFELGYRWLTDVRGNFQEYRSVINLGEGPKLFGADFTIQDPKRRLFDRIDVRASGWGGDPYTTGQLNARKLGVYDLSFDYRNISYFNAIPTFANPIAPAGFNEQSFDLHRRMYSFALDLRPGKQITPYLAFDRNTGYGHGVDTWVQDQNDEFAVPTLFRDSTNNYRGGVRFEFMRFHLTLEQGGTTYKDDDQTNYSGNNRCDRTNPVLGQTLVLTGLSQAYGIRGHSIYEKAMFTARAASWMDVYAQFLYSEPKTDVHFSDLANGNFALLSSLLFYSSQYTLGTGTAVQPHVSGNAGFELRPLRRLRIIESWMTDRYHDAASPVVAEALFFKTGAQNVPTSLNYAQVVNYNQQQTDVLFDLTSKLTVRGGYRYVWGDAGVLAGQLSQTGPFAVGTLKRNIGLAGLNFRPSEKLAVNLDYEGASSDNIYFRTSLNDYHKVRARARYQLLKQLSLQGSFLVLNNQNPSSDIHYDFQSRNNSISLFWTPGGGKRISVMGEYDRSTLRSDIGYLALFLAPATSSYRENAHTATSAIDISLPGVMGAKLTAGGSFFLSAGSRPTSFYQPLLRLSVPLQKHVAWNTTWQYYGFGESFYVFEGFHTHVFMTGVRVTP